MSNQENEIKIYVACLAAYNSGYLHGSWINALQDPDIIRAEISEMLQASPIPNAEEYAIHDYEGFEGFGLSEYEGIDRVAKLAEFISTHGSIAGKLLDHYGGDLNEAKTAIEEHYCGRYRSAAEFAEELTEQTGSIPENLHYYIDYAAMARDLVINDVLAIETGFEEVHIFWRH